MVTHWQCCLLKSLKTTLRDQVVIVGHGEVGRRITKQLMAEDIKVVIAEENREIVENLREKGIAAVSGMATDPGY